MRGTGGKYRPRHPATDRHAPSSGGGATTGDQTRRADRNLLQAQRVRGVQAEHGRGRRCAGTRPAGGQRRRPPSRRTPAAPSTPRVGEQRWRPAGRGAEHGRAGRPPRPRRRRPGRPAAAPMSVSPRHQMPSTSSGQNEGGGDGEREPDHGDTSSAGDAQRQHQRHDAGHERGEPKSRIEPRPTRSVESTPAIAVSSPDAVDRNAANAPAATSAPSSWPARPPPSAAPGSTSTTASVSPVSTAAARRPGRAPRTGSGKVEQRRPGRARPAWCAGPRAPSGLVWKRTSTCGRPIVPRNGARISEYAANRPPAPWLPGRARPAGARAGDRASARRPGTSSTVGSSTVCGPAERSYRHATDRRGL